jgi:hypothetical protein
MRILVCDDRNPDEIAEAIAVGAPPGFDVQSLPPTDLKTLITEFFERGGGAGGVTPFLKKKAADRSAELLGSGFDGYDLIILDNNLAELSFLGLPITAEAIAGFVRAFSDTPYVVSLNKNPAVDFDLKYLIGDFDSKADLALNTDHLESPTLWGSGEAAADNFAPWYWPNLSSSAAKRREQIDFVLRNLDQPILASLGFPKSAIEGLSRRAVGFLSSAAVQPGNATSAKAKPAAKITFWNHFQNSGRSLPIDYRAAVAFPEVKSDSVRRDRLLSASKAPDDALVRQIVARVVAAELDYWFRRDVLANQDVLVDAPHLKMRIGLKPDGEHGSDSSVDATNAPFGFLPAIYDSLIAERLFCSIAWTGRPAFWWSEIEGDKRLQEVRAEHLAEPIWVFCEDTRRFVERGPVEPSGVSFVPEGGKPWAPLFVQRIQGKGYMPASQFAA